MKTLLVSLVIFYSSALCLGQGYYIKDYYVSIEINKNGSLSVKEQIKANFTEQKRGIIRVIPSSYYLKDGDSGYKNYKIAFDSIQVDDYNFEVSKLNNKLEIKIGDPDMYLTGEQDYTIRYDVWGVAQKYEDYEEVSWNIIGNQWDTYIENASFTVKLPNQQVLEDDDIKVYTGKQGARDNHVNLVNSSPIIKGSLTKTLNAGEGITLSLKFPEKTFSFEDIPIQFLSNSYYVRKATANFKIQNNGSVDISQNYDVVFKENTTNGFNAEIKMAYEYNQYFNDFTDSLLSYPKYGLLNNVYYPTIKNIITSELSDLYLSDSKYITSHTISTHGSGKVTTSFSYNVFDLFEKVGSNFEYRALAFVNFNEYSKNHKFTIELPSNAEQNEWTTEACIVEPYTDMNYSTRIRKTKLIPDSISKNQIWYSNSGVLSEYQRIYFVLKFPQKYINNISMYDQFILHLNNNKLYITPIIIFILLFALWIFWGKDEKFTAVTQFYPPKGMTPAEAGILWDYKLDKRDMISLIYHWSGNGYIKVKTIDNDVELIKIRELPKSANKYELTLYKGIFNKTDTKKVSELNTNTFASAWTKAFKQLNDKVVKEGMFNKTSLVLGKTLIRAGVVVLFSTIAYALYEYSHFGNYQGPLSATICGFIFIGFGLIMPRRAKNGTKQYANLIGFVEFIKTAEIDKVRTLYTDDSSYFDRTISYAIVTGMGEIWAKKFADLVLLTQNEQGNDTESTNSISLFKNITSNMKHFDSFARTNIKSYSGSGSSYSHSSFGSSYSGSSFSSGSSGFSGSGFGGGGGSSW